MTSTATRRGPDAPTGPSGPASPLPAEPHGSRSNFAWLLDLPAEAIRRITRSAAATPGRLSLILVGLVVLSLLAGLFGILAVQDRHNTIDELVGRREPVAVAAQQVYRSLSDADATIASAMLSFGNESEALSERYRKDLAEAGSALAKAASDSADVPEAAGKVRFLSRQLPVYAGLVETARVHNEQADLAGAAHLREASNLMHTEILPAAHRLYEINTERLLAEQDNATDFPWLATWFVCALVVALVGTQIYLKRKTKRVFNVGLVVSTIAVGIAVLWTAVALLVQGMLVDSGRQDGTEQIDLLVEARITALQARSNEMLTLMARDEGAEYEREFTELFQRLAGSEGHGGLLAQAQRQADEESQARGLQVAAEAATAWLRAHDEMRKLDESGDYQGAVTLAIDPHDVDSAAVALTRIDEGLATAIGDRRTTFLSDSTDASRAFTLLTPGLVLLTVIAALGATLGIRERLREYR